METGKIHNVYFAGIGGIGMSALARYFNHIGKNVAGYDRTSTPLTVQLQKEGIDIHFEDNIDKIDKKYKDKENTLVIITPAIPSDHNELGYFEKNNFCVIKRAKALGAIVNERQGIAVSGTHGKTTVTTLISYLLKNSKVDCSAFLGGISKNFDTNYLFSANSNYIAVEADEFDRSFLHLKPQIAIVTAIDADHLEIYGNRNNIVDSFNIFINQVRDGGTLIINSKILSQLSVPEKVKVFSYSLDNTSSDFYIKDKKLNNGLYTFTLHIPNYDIEEITSGIPGTVNLENAVAACAAAMSAGVKAEEIRKALPGFKGVKRRFDVLYKSDKHTYIDDYAHHPEEIKRFVESVREIYTGKKITGIFQPHLFTRTRDFANDFAASLSLLDKLYLLDIYPARESAIPGVTSEVIFKNVTAQEKILCSKNNILSMLKGDDSDVFLTIGAGDIDSLAGSILELMKEKN